jgi:hypothetical protein
MESNTKGTAHRSCSCRQCRPGLDKKFRREREHKLRQAVKRAIKRSLDKDFGEELLLVPEITGYTD